MKFEFVSYDGRYPNLCSGIPCCKLNKSEAEKRLEKQNKELKELLVKASNDIKTMCEFCNDKNDGINCKETGCPCYETVSTSDLSWIGHCSMTWEDDYKVQRLTRK